MFKMHTCKSKATYLRDQWMESLWPNDDFWGQRSSLSLAPLIVFGAKLWSEKISLSNIHLRTHFNKILFVIKIFSSDDDSIIQIFRCQNSDKVIATTFCNYQMTNEVIATSPLHETLRCRCIIMTSSNWNIFRITGSPTKENTGGFLSGRPVTRSLTVILSAPGQTVKQAIETQVDLRCHGAHFWRHCDVCIELINVRYLNEAISSCFLQYVTQICKRSYSLLCWLFTISCL